MQKGANAQPTLEGVHQKVQHLNDLILPKGVTLVPFIDRSQLLRLTTGTVHVVWRLDFSLSYNTGSAFSLFQGDTGILVVVAVVLVAVLLVMVWRAATLGRAVILGLILGGALGNLCDRFFRGEHGAVVDYVDFHFFPSFNVADSCITVGCILLILSILFEGRRA